MDNIYNIFNRDLYRIDSPSNESSGAKKIVNPDSIDSGGSVDQQNVYVGSLVAGKQNFSNNESGYILGIDKGIPKFYIGNSTNYLNWTGTSLDISGNINATTGTIGGFSIGADYIRDSANSFGLASTVTGGDDIRFWAGDTYANRATAPFRLTESGAVSATSLTLYRGSTAIIDFGTISNTAQRINLDSTTTTGLNIISSSASTLGMNYANSANVDATAINLQMTGTSNTGTLLNMVHAGSSGEALYIQVSNGAKGINFDLSGSSAGIYSSTSSSALFLEVLKSGTGGVVWLESSNTNLNSNVLYLTANSTDSSATVATFNRSSSYTVLKITQTSNDSNRQYGVHFNLNNSSTGAECAFRFEGSEYDGSKTSVSGLTGVIKVYPDTEGNVCYIPVYSSAS